MKHRVRPVRAIIENLHELTHEDITSSGVLEDLLMEEIPGAIDKAVTEGKQYASLIEINSTGEYVDLHKRDWIKALNSCVTYFASPEVEDYETCSKISELIEKLSKKKGKLKIKTTEDGRPTQKS
jgi:hypothetical protein